MANEERIEHKNSGVDQSTTGQEQDEVVNWTRRGRHQSSRRKGRRIKERVEKGDERDAVLGTPD
jgi:hypothetical protein